MSSSLHTEVIAANAAYAAAFGDKASLALPPARKVRPAAAMCCGPSTRVTRRLGSRGQTRHRGPPPLVCVAH